MSEVRLGEEAAAEYLQALAWYQARSVLAAVGFEAAFAEAVALIGQAPEQFPPCDEEGFRFVTVKRYPYSLIYRVADTGAQVIAVAHSRRKPGYWSGRTSFP